MSDGETHYYGCETEHKECKGARFLRECERRTGVPTKDMLRDIEKYPIKDGMLIQRDTWLRRILTGAE